MYHATKSSFSYLSTCHVHLKGAQVWRDVAHRGSKHLRGPIGGLHWRSSWRGSNLVVPAQRASMAPSCPKVIQRRRQRSRVSSRRQHFNLHLKASSDHLHSHPEGQRWRDWLVRVWLWFYWCTCHANILSSIETILQNIMWRSSRFVARRVSWKSAICNIMQVFDPLEVRGS
jgi:hypothetical protein